MKLLYSKLLEKHENYYIAEDTFDEYEVPVERVYNKDGILIGNKKDAMKVIDTVDYATTIDSDHVVCSIGYCKASNSWSGWSYSNLASFTIGSEVKFGDIAFNPTNKEELLAALKLWYNDKRYTNLEIREKRNKIIITFYERNRKGSLLKREVKQPTNIEYGRGAWVAETIEDAKQMAIDYAKNVR